MFQALVLVVRGQKSPRFWAHEVDSVERHTQAATASSAQRSECGVWVQGFRGTDLSPQRLGFREGFLEVVMTEPQDMQGGGQARCGECRDDDAGGGNSLRKGVASLVHSALCSWQLGRAEK